MGKANNSPYSGKIVLTFDRELYSKEALFKAAYHFIDSCYVYIDQTGKDYIVELKSKDSSSMDRIPDEFQNELLAQVVRLQVYQRTRIVRELLMGRAMSSTMIMNDIQVLKDERCAEKEDRLEEILTDWFERYE